jgi:uncharacterized protein YdeI (YjbR/CyaY-like superfamily)
MTAPPGRDAGIEPVFFDGPEAFEAWLEANGTTSDGLWVKMAKKNTGIPSLDWTRGVEAALCFGWIDGQSRRIDEQWFMQRFTPRRPRSIWSKVNRQKVEALVAAGRMRPAGLAEVQRAKDDGRWEAAYDGMATASVPDDLAAALEGAGVSEAFAALSAQSRYTILHRVQTAKRPETRVRRITQFVEQLATGGAPQS